MASAGTLLSDLDSRTPAGGDEDLVHKILADMNTPSEKNPVIQPPPNPGMDAARRMISSPNPNTTMPHNMDPTTPTAHLIGRDYPTPADFASMMSATGGYGYAPVTPQQMPQPTLAAPPKSNWYGEIVGQFRQPILVAIIVFIISLPAVNILVGFYLPSLLRAGGDLTTMGLLVKSLAAGTLFWFIQRVLVPLMAV
jgi:hypothetical protein